MRSRESVGWQNSQGAQPADSARVCTELGARTAVGNT